MSLFNSLAGGIGNAGIISVYAASIVCVGSLLVQTNPLHILGISPTSAPQGSALHLGAVCALLQHFDHTWAYVHVACELGQ